MWTINEKTCITLILLGLTAIIVSLPLYLGKVKRNIAYGFRIKKAFESDQNWYLINRYGAKLLIIWAICLMAAATIGLFIPPEHVLTVAKAGIVSIIVPVLLTMGFARRL
jgi:uncharacterized membrane protein